MERSRDTRIYGEPALDHSADAESLAGLYAFGALDGADLLRFERHLADCGRCQEVVDGDRAMVYALTLTAPEVEPSAGFKERLLERAGAELSDPAASPPSGIIRLPRATPPDRSLAWLLPLAAVILALFVGAGLVSQQIRAAQVVQTAQLENRAEGGSAAVLVRPSGEGVIQLSGFEDLRDGRVYQAWVIREGSPPLATGASSSGNGTLTLDGDVRGATVAVTLEPGPGARAPSVQPFLVGQVPS